MHTLDHSKDTSIPACCSIAVLHFAMLGPNQLAPRFPILSGDSYLTARSEQGPLRHLIQLNDYACDWPRSRNLHGCNPVQNHRTGASRPIASKATSKTIVKMVRTIIVSSRCAGNYGVRCGRSSSTRLFPSVHVQVASARTVLRRSTDPSLHLLGVNAFEFFMLAERVIRIV